MPTVADNKYTRDLITHKEMPAKAKCQKFACAIQTCLNRNQNNANKCQDALKLLEECCIQTSRKGVNEQIPCSGFTKQIQAAYKKELKMRKKAEKGAEKN